ncbi:MAG: DUF5615 family PIN-like protein [Planctomycetes bacterium]|nr:DUF5615 family PIN-like protein [Planctomycetota bacterium]
MLIKLDENIPDLVADRLRQLGHEVHTIREEGLTGASDERVSAELGKERRFLVTQDLDFSDARRFVENSPMGVLIVRLSNPTRRQIASRVEEVFVGQAEADLVGSITIATEKKIRVRRIVVGG